MSRKVSFKLSGEKLNVALKFANDLGMDLNQATEKALYYTINAAYLQGQQEAKLHGQSAQAVPAGHSPDSGTTADSGAPLADSEAVDAPVS